MKTQSNSDAAEVAPAATCSAVAEIMERIEGEHIEEVMASTQYGMGFALVSKGASHHLNGIVLRNDDLSHDERKIVADHVNALLSLRQNAQHETRDE